MRKGLVLKDEAGNNILEAKLPPLATKIKKFTDGMKDGDVIGIKALTTKLSAGDSSMRSASKLPALSGRSILVHGRLYFCNPSTYKAYHEKN